ncbi:hypothetical protein B0H12DRAFT_1246480 [Mycena haematopus]|nr:hypothetical protein B0H12DRAFT_1246480 [Mycena haematopus]
MPNHRPYISPTSRKAVVKAITGRLYGAHHRATSVSVPARCSSTNARDPRVPIVESVMGQSYLQPYVHDVVVLVTHRCSDDRITNSWFRIFFKRHVHLSYNWRLDLKGDIMVMRIASKNRQSVVNLRSSDAKIADFIVASLAEKLRAFQGPKRKQMRLQLLIMSSKSRARARRT